MPPSGAMSVRNISPRCCSATVRATSTLKTCLAPLLSTVTTAFAVCCAAAALPASPLLHPGVSASAPSASSSGALVHPLDHDRERTLVPLDDAGTKRLFGFNVINLR